MKKQKTSRIAANYYLFLEDAPVIEGALMDIPTKTKKSVINEQIRINISGNPIDDLKKEPLDIALIFHVNKQRFKHQDLDNVAKIVLDALQKPKDPQDKRAYFFENDNQIVRLLLQKMEREEDPDSETSMVSISIRKYEPEKGMVLKESKMN